MVSKVSLILMAQGPDPSCGTGLLGGPFFELTTPPVLLAAPQENKRSQEGPLPGHTQLWPSVVETLQLRKPSRTSGGTGWHMWQSPVLPSIPYELLSTRK